MFTGKNLIIQRDTNWLFNSHLEEKEHQTISSQISNGKIGRWNFNIRTSESLQSIAYLFI